MKLIVLIIFLLIKYIAKVFDKYPIEKKKINELNDAPVPKKTFS